jgi:hypothetical protein
MPRGEGGGRKRKYHTDEEKRAARAQNNAKYDGSNKCVWINSHSGSSTDTELPRRSLQRIRQLLAKAWPPDHPLCVSSSAAFRTIPHDFEYDSTSVPSERKDQVTLWVPYSASVEFFNGFENYAPRSNIHNRFYLTYLDSPLYTRLEAPNPLEGLPYDQLGQLEDADIQEQFAGWWICKIVTYFADIYFSVLPDPANTRIPSESHRLLNVTRRLIDDANKMWLEIRSCQAAEEVLSTRLSQPDPDETRSQLEQIHQRLLRLLIQEYTWWRYQHLALLRYELYQRCRLTYADLFLQFEDGNAPWQTEWDVSEEYEMKIKSLCQLLPAFEEDAESSVESSSSLSDLDVSDDSSTDTEYSEQMQ